MYSFSYSYRVLQKDAYCHSRTEPGHCKRYFCKDRGSTLSCIGNKANKTLGIIGKKNRIWNTTPLCICVTAGYNHTFDNTHSSAPQLRSSIEEGEEIQRKATRMSRARELLYAELFSVSGVSRLRYDQGTQNPQWHIEGWIMINYSLFLPIKEPGGANKTSMRQAQRNRCRKLCIICN